MVERKFFVFQMIPHTLFIEWDFGHCSLVVLFMALFTSLFTVHDIVLLAVKLFTTLLTSRCEGTVHIYATVHVYGTVHIYGTIHTTSFFL